MTFAGHCICLAEVVISVFWLLGWKCLILWELELKFPVSYMSSYHELIVLTISSIRPIVLHWIQEAWCVGLRARYASLYFCCCVESNDNELLCLEVIHRYVELLDKYFGSVSM